jgi:hypothetical protein
MTMTRSIRILGATLLLALLLVGMPGLAVACAIDSTASLSADGVRAALTTTSPTDPAHWARFSFPQSFASGRVLRFDESRAELARTLPPGVVDAPYRWTFGDGAVTLGREVSHRYARPGSYRLAVSGFDQRSRRLFEFDNAMVYVVSPDQAFAANLGYYALRALDVAMSGLLWVFDAALVLLVAFVLLGRRRARARRLSQ